MIDFEIDIDSLDAKSRNIVETLGFITHAEWDTARALAKNLEGLSGITDAINEVHGSLNDIREALRLEAKDIAISQGAQSGDIVTFLSIFNETIVTVEIKEE